MKTAKLVYLVIFDIMFDKGSGGLMAAVNPQKIKLLKQYEIFHQYTGI